MHITNLRKEQHGKVVGICFIMFFSVVMFFLLVILSVAGNFIFTAKTVDFYEKNIFYCPRATKIKISSQFPNKATYLAAYIIINQKIQLKTRKYTIFTINE